MDTILFTILKAIVGVIAPLIASLFLGVFGKLVGFVYFEFLNLTRILILLAVLTGSLFLAPYFAPLITFLVFGAMVMYSLAKSYWWPDSVEGGVFFLGFYDNSDAKGYLSRTGPSRSLESQFLKKFQELIDKASQAHGIELEVVDLRIPSVIHSWFDIEDIREHSLRFTSKGLAAVWGTTDKDGNLQHLETNLNTERFFGRDRAQDHIDGVLQILRNADARSSAKASLIAHVLASYWINSFNNFLAMIDQWEKALDVSRAGKRVLQTGLRDFETLSKNDQQIVDFIRRMVQPNFDVEEARARLYGKQWDGAIDHLVDLVASKPLLSIRFSR